MQQNDMTSLRVYRTDNGEIEPEYIAVINQHFTLTCDLIGVELPEWKHAWIRLVCRIACPDQSLLDHSATALGGWHYLLDKEDIDTVEGMSLLVYPDVAPFLAFERGGNGGYTTSLANINTHLSYWSWGALAPLYNPYGTGRPAFISEIEDLFSSLHIPYVEGSIEVYNQQICWQQPASATYEPVQYTQK